MLLDVTEVRDPHERRAIVAEHVVDPRSVFAARNRESLHPQRRVLGRVLLVEVLAINPLREAFERQRSVAQMRQNHLRDFGVERDHLALGESALGKVNLVHIRDCQLAAFDFDELLLRHWD